MLARRLTSRARPLASAAQSYRPRASLLACPYATDADVEDPNMNGGYINPPPIKRQFRDPNADWWDKQERRNYGEPVHEDNDIMGVFSTEEYTHYKPGFGLVLMGCFVASVGALCGAVYLTYPDRPAVPRTFPDGLEKELGGERAVRAPKEGDFD